MSFEDNCRHCEHYHEKAGTCCFCKKLNVPDIQIKSRAQHLEELGEDEIDT